MLEGLISSVLNRFLGTFIENLDSDQLNISLWSGQVKLENLQIRQNIFDSMPLPFTLHYGKVGKILLEIPLYSIQSSPLKIEISDVFIFVKPKHFDLWNEKVEIEAFINKTLQFLDKYENYLSETTQLEQSNPGMMANLIQNIVDNIQLKISNIYIRVEDELSIPQQPFAMGIILGEMSAKTMNEYWQEDFVSGKEITNKQFTIKDFAVYQNFSHDYRDVTFDEITKDWKDMDIDAKYQKFLKQECSFTNKNNNYIVERFQIQVRASLNKNVKNAKPQVWSSIALGGEFQGPNHEITTQEGQYFYFSVQQQQITSLLKLLEYIGNYSKFQAGVIAQFYKKEMNSDEENEYMELYINYKDNMRDKKDVKLADQYLQSLRNKYERSFPYEKLIMLRTIATKKFEFEQLKHKEETKVEDLVKEYEQSKQGYFNSMKGWLGYGKTEDQYEEEKKQIEEYRQKLVTETQNNLEQQSEQLKEEIETIKKKKTGDIQERSDLDTLLGTEYVQFDIMINIPELHMVLRRGDNKQLIELLIEKMKAHNQKGLDFVDAQLTLNKFCIIDHFSESKVYPYLIETYTPLSEQVMKKVLTKNLFGLTFDKQVSRKLDNEDKLDEKNALNLRFLNHPRKNKNSPLKLTMTSDSQLLIILNLVCLNELQSMFGKAFQNQEGMIDYYKNVASEQVFRYVLEGSEYMMNNQEVQEEEQKKEPKHASIILDMSLNAPVLIIPQDYDRVDNNQVLVMDLGNIIIDSRIAEFDPQKNYKLEENFMLLYDAYNFTLKDLQILAFDQLSDYHRYKTEKSVKLIKDVTLALKFYYCLELKHPIYPLYEINAQLQKMNILASDYIAQFMYRLQEALNAMRMNASNSSEIKPVEEETSQEQSEEKKKESFKFGATQNIQIDDISDAPSLQEDKRTKSRGPGNKSYMINEDESMDFKSCMSGSRDLEADDDLASHRSLPSNARIQMIKKMPEKQIQAMKNMRKKDQISVNVILNIGELVIQVMEEIKPDDPLMSNPFFLLQSTNFSRPHKELLIIKIEELIASFHQDHQGIQKVTLILNSFDVQDRNVEVKFETKNELMPVIPEVYSHIIGNPEFASNDRTETQAQNQNPNLSNFNGIIPDASNYKRYASSANYSVMSMQFKSCISGASEASLNIKEIEKNSQIYIRALIDPDPFQTKQEVDFIFSDMRIVVSFATFQKLFQFSKRLQPEKSEDERMSMLFEEQQKRFIVDRIEGNSTATSRLGTQVAIKKIEDTKMGNYSRRIQETKMKRQGQDSYSILTSERKTKLKFSGRFKNLSLWIPIDETVSNSRVISFSLMSQINYRKDSVEIDFTNSVTRDVIMSQTQLSREDAIVTLNQLQIQMINRHLLTNEEDEPDVEKLLEPSRVTLTYENFIKDKGLNTWMNIDMLVEPFELKLGFREIEFFNKLSERAQKFLTVISQPDDMLDMTLDTEIDVEKELSKFRHNQLKEISNAMQSTSTEKRAKIKKEEQINVLTVKFRCDTFRFSLMDDTGLQEYPVIFMNIRNIKYDSKKYEDIDDAAVFILKKMGLMKKKNEDEEPYLITNASLNLEVYYFNMKIQAYEPVLEPWSLEFTQFQEERYITQRSTIKSDQMLNMNVTFALMEALTKIQKRLAQTSDDWEDELRGSVIQKKTTGVSNDGIMSQMQKKNSQIQIENENQQTGFVFINRLGIDSKFYIEGQQAHDLKQQIVNGLFGNKNSNIEEEKELNFEDAMNTIDNNDPKAHFKKLAIIRKMNSRKRTLEKQIEKETCLDKKGPNMKKFRKADELFYLMKQIKNGENNANHSSAFDDQILRIDLQIEGLKKIKGIPIELGGVRSFLLEIKKEQRNSITEYNTIRPTPQVIFEAPVAVLCKVQFENQNKKEVEFQSSLMFSNNSDSTIIIYGASNPQMTQKNIKRDSFMNKNGFINNLEVPEMKQVQIEPNKVFFVPLSWFIKRKSIYVKQKDNFELLFPDIREHFNPLLSQHKHLKAKNIEILDELDTVKYVSCNISLFKCKPTTLNVPGQFLVTFTPPLCLCNYLFNDLILLSESKMNVLTDVASQSYSYINKIKFDENDKSVTCKQLVNWKFTDNQGNYYISEEAPLFLATKKKQQASINENLMNQIVFINNNSNQMIQQTNEGFELLDESEQCIINLEQTSFNLLQNEYDNFEMRDKVFELTSAVALYVYPQSMIVNQTNQDIYIKTKVSNNKQKVVCIKAHRNEFFYSQSNKAQLMVNNYQWSKVFDVTTLGLTGSIELSAMKDATQNIINFGIIIENGMNEFSKTKIIKIVPRYIIYNNLDDPIIVRQKNHNEQICIYPRDKAVFNFVNKAKDAFLVIRDMEKNGERVDKIDESLIQQDNLWSSPFSIEDIEDFQVEFQSSYFKNEKRYEPQSQLMSVLMGSNTARKKTPWHLPNDNNFQKRIVRVSINTQDDATIFVIVSKPKFPEYYIFNNTEVDIGVNQFKCIEEQRIIKPGQRVPFVWRDQTQAIKKVSFYIDGKSQVYAIDKIKKFKKDFSTQYDQYYVEVLTSGDVRTVEVRSKSVEQRLMKYKEKGSSQLAKLFLQSFLKRGFLFNVDLKGFGFSLIDNEPKEIIYMSVYKIQFLVEKWSESITRKDNTGAEETIQEANTKYDLKIDHIQIDNILNDDMPVFFCPTKELIRDREIQMNEDGIIPKQENTDYTPFIQIMITYSEIQEKDVYIKKYRGLQIQIQEMKLEVETGLVNALMKFSYQIQQIRSQGAQFISGYTYLQHKLTRGESKNYGSFAKGIKSREEQCPSLIATLPEPPNMADVTAKKTYFEFVNFGAIKCRITLRFERKAFELNIDDPKQGFGFGSIFYTLFTTVAAISDSPLTFKELILMHTFTSQQNLISMTTRNYTRQGILQFYKLLGSSDLLGNPVGLIDKLGTGVFEFFNEPRKGLVKGPKEFVGGVGKGVKSLVSNIVSGSFDSVSKITGSLYGVVKNVSGDQVNDQQLKKPEHAFDGVYQGLMGGAGEIVSGFTGIFTKPFQKAKEEGAKGFVKGLGSGLLGAVASPFAATLRLGTNISTGIKNSAIRLGKGKLPNYGRFRHPRYFNSKSILEPYAEAFAEANQILRTLNNGKFANSTIRFFADFSQRKGRDQTNGILIITDQNLLYVKDLKYLAYICQLEQILKCEVYQESIQQTIKALTNAQKAQKKEQQQSLIKSKNKIGKNKGNKSSELQNTQNYVDPIKLRYHIHVETHKKGMLKIENDNYPIADKVFTILNK